jgi:hypothetical protein
MFEDQSAEDLHAVGHLLFINARDLETDQQQILALRISDILHRIARENEEQS